MEGLDLFHGPNAGYALDLYDHYLSDRESVDPQTRALFDLLPLAPGAMPVSSKNGAVSSSAPNGATATTNGAAPLNLAAIGNAARLARNIRGRGHLAARIDPLGSEPQGNPGLSADTYNLTPQDLAALPAEVVGGPAARDAASAGEAIDRLRTIYEGATGYDYSHVHDPEERAWLREAVESGHYRAALSTDEQRAVLQLLTCVEALERFLHQSYRDQKRFSIEGVDALAPMLDDIIRAAAGVGTREVVIGMAHRGRLNVLAHVLGKPYKQLIKEFRDAASGQSSPASDPT
ncbi:MAG: 2-oxoglutarate dehydrogenase E1 component, partial [Chloroflexota bacterium]|nr:2-oxoglutarate dehydrogenase E1 component [Chloroflexota bacterium]